VPYLSASEVVIHEENVCKVYVPLPSNIQILPLPAQGKMSLVEIKRGCVSSGKSSVKVSCVFDVYVVKDCRPYTLLYIVLRCVVLCMRFSFTSCI